MEGEAVLHRTHRDPLADEPRRCVRDAARPVLARGAHLCHSCAIHAAHALVARAREHAAALRCSRGDKLVFISMLVCHVSFPPRLRRHDNR